MQHAVVAPSVAALAGPRRTGELAQRAGHRRRPAATARMTRRHPLEPPHRPG